MAINAEYMTFLGRHVRCRAFNHYQENVWRRRLFRHGLMYGLALSDGQISLKANELTVPDFEAEGCSEWEYKRKDGKAATMGYWYIPEYFARRQRSIARMVAESF